MEPREGELWPAGRSLHAACCLGYAGDHIHLLVTGGVGKDDKLLTDTWLFNLSLKKWKEVRCLLSLHVVLIIIIIMSMYVENLSYTLDIMTMWYTYWYTGI